MKIKKTMPSLLYVIRDSEGTLLCDTGYDGMNDGDEVAIYALVKTARVSTAVKLESIEDVPVDIEDVTRPSAGDICAACGHTRSWHDAKHPRHPFKLTQDVDNMSHEQLVSYAKLLRLKLKTKGMDTKTLRSVLRDYQNRRSKR